MHYCFPSLCLPALAALDGSTQQFRSRWSPLGDVLGLAGDASRMVGAVGSGSAPSRADRQFVRACSDRFHIDPGSLSCVMAGAAEKASPSQTPYAGECRVTQEPFLDKHAEIVHDRIVNTLNLKWNAL